MADPGLNASRRASTLIALAAGVISLLLYLATAAPGLYFGDSGELIAAAHSHGVAHPPGYPLYTGIGRLLLTLPGAAPARVMNLLSAFFAALTCAGVAWLVHRWSGSPRAAAAAALGLMGCATFWSVSTVAEVYTLHLALVILLLACATWLGELAPSSAAFSRALIFGSAILGLGLSHRPTILLALPAAWILARPGFSGSGRPAGGARRGSPGGWGRALALLLVPLIPALFYLGMMLRSRAAPLSNWGRPDDLSRLFSHLSTRIYGTYVLGPSGWLRAEAWLEAGRLIWFGFAYVAAPLALLGLVVGLFGRSIPPGARRGAQAVLRLALPAVLFGLSYATEDVEVLFLPLLLAVALACGLGIAVVERMGPRGSSLAALLLALALSLSPLIANLPHQNLRHARAAEWYADDMLSTLPPRSVLFVNGDDAFVLAYRIQVLGERPDLTVYDREGSIFGDELNENGSKQRSRESALDYRIRREQEFAVAELRRPDSRPVFFMTWPGYELPEELRFEPEGLFYRLRRADERRADGAAAWSAYHEEEVRREALRFDRPFGLSVAAFYPLMRGERALFDGREHAARIAFEEASSLARYSESIHNYLGTIYGRRGDYPAAVREFREALRIKPVSIRAWNNLAFAHRLSGEPDAAEQAWRESLKLAQNQPAVAEQLRKLRKVSD